MTDVSIVGADGVTFTFLEGEVADVDSDIASGSEIQSAFGSGPATAFGYVMDGPTKIITVSGLLFDTTAEGTRTSTGTTVTINAQKQWLEKQINGSQTLKTFTSNYESETYGAGAFVPTKVLIGRIQFRERSGSPDELQFTMRLLVGGA